MLPPNLLNESHEKIENSRIDRKLAETLIQDCDLDQLQCLADHARKKKAGDKVFFINNYHLYYTNICAWKCRFCAFGRKPSAPDAYSKTLDDIAKELLDIPRDISEIRVTGGVNPQLGLSYYEELLAFIKDEFPQAHIEAFAATEIGFIARMAKLSPEKVLTRLSAAGLGSLTSGGAEIFNEKLRQKLCPKKSSIQTWLEITKLAHTMGIHSNASILFGHIEKYGDWLDHLYALRHIQDETGMFNSFVPLRFIPKNSELEDIPQVDFSEALKMIALARIVLDNFKSIKFLWLFYGKDQAKEALRFGANDLAGTATEKHKGVARSAGSGTAAQMARNELIDIIRDCQRIPVERGKLFEEKCVYQ